VPLTILQRVARADAAAVDECLNAYGGLVWSLARRLCRKHVDAEDAVQEIFVEIWRKAEKFDPDIASESTYITMIAQRRLIDRYRRESRSPEVGTLVEGIISSESEHEKQAEIVEEATRAREYMQQLRPAERQVLELAINDGLSQSEIAESTNMPLGTVKTHSRRGLIRLRQLLGVDADAAVRSEKRL